MRTCQDLAYRLCTICERKGWAQEALSYNGLVVECPELVRVPRPPAAPASSSSAWWGMRHER